MKMRSVFEKGLYRRPELRGAVFLGLCFSFGAIAGLFTAEYVAPAELAEISGYVQDYAELTAADTGGVSFFGTAAAYFRYPLAVLLLGLSVIGPAAVPLVLAVQGFSTAFAAAVFARSLGRQGVLLALGAFGVRNLLVLPCTIFLGCAAFLKKRGQYGPLLRRAAACVFFLLLGAILEQSFLPKILEALLRRLS